MLGKRFCGYEKDGLQLLLSDDEIIKNALEQEKDGVNPPFPLAILLCVGYYGHIYILPV